MNATEILKHSLESSTGWAMGLITDMQDAPLTQPAANGGNHPLWVLGHLVHSESNLLDGFILGQPNRFPELEANFAMGTTPTTDASQYPTMDELLVKFKQIRTASLAHLETLSESDLDKPTQAPEEFANFFGTVGACFSAMSTHMNFHAGQVAVARLADGRKPLMA